MDTGKRRPVMKSKNTLFTKSKLYNHAKVEINARNKVRTPDTRGGFLTEAESIHQWASVLGLTF